MKYKNYEYIQAHKEVRAGPLRPLRTFDFIIESWLVSALVLIILMIKITWSV